MTPRLTARVAGRTLVPLLVIADLGEGDAVYSRREATGLRPDSDYLFRAPSINI